MIFSNLKLDKKSAYQLIFLSFIFTTVFLSSLEISKAQSQIKLDNYESLDVPDIIYEYEMADSPFITLSYKNDTLDKVKNFFNLPIELNNDNFKIKRIAKSIRFEVGTDSLYNDFQRLDSIKSQTNYWNNSNITIPPTINLVLFDAETFIEVSALITSLTNIPNPFNYIYLGNTDNKQYLNLNNSLNIMGMNKNVSLSIESILYMKYIDLFNFNDIFTKQITDRVQILPFHILKQENTGTPALLLSIDSFFTILNNVEDLPVYNLAFEYKLTLDSDAKINVENFYENQYYSDTIELFEFFYLLPKDVFFNASFTAFDVNFINTKKFSVEQTTQNTLSILLLFWSFNLFIIIITKISIFKNINESSKWSDTELYLIQNGSTLKQIMIEKYKFVSITILIGSLLSLMFILIIFNLNGISSIFENNYRNNEIKIDLIIIISAILIQNIIYLLFLFKTRYNSIIKKQIKIDNNELQQISNEKMFIFLVLPSLPVFFWFGRNIIVSEISISSFLAELDLFSFSLFIVFPIFISLILILKVKQIFFSYMILVLNATFKVVNLKKLSKTFVYNLRSFIRVLKLNKAKSLNYILLIFLIVLFSGWLVFENQQISLINKENLEIGADIQINSAFNSLDDIKNDLEIIESQINGSSYEITPFWLFKTTLLLESNLGNPVNVNVLSLNFSKVIKFFEYNNLQLNAKIIDLIPNSSYPQILISEQLIDKFDLTNEETINIKSVGTNILDKNIENYTNLKIEGNYIYSSKLFDFEPSLILDLSASLSLLNNNLLNIHTTEEQGYLVWFGNIESANISKISTNWETMSSPQFGKQLGELNLNYVNLMRTHLNTLSLILIIFFGIISYLTIVNILETESTIIEYMVFKKNGNQAIYSFLLVNLLWLLVLLIISFSVSYLVGQMIVFLFLDNFLLNFRLNFPILTFEVILISGILFIIHLLICHLTISYKISKFRN